MSSNFTFVVSSLDYISKEINLYFSIFIFLFGIVGNILNIFVLSQRPLRSNPCAWLFLISSFANFIAILSGLTTRIISNWTTDITDTIGSLCKIRVFILTMSRNIASWLIVLASIDRWLLSCPNIQRRQMSTLKIVQKGTMIITLFSILLYSPIFYCYEANLINTPLKCYSKNIQCRIYSDQSYTFVTILLPLILIALFGLMTILNLRQIQRQIQPISSSSINNMKLKKFDHRLRIMLFVHISLFALFTIPQTTQAIYSTITQNNLKSKLMISIENFIYMFTILFTYLASGISFYTYTLTGGYVFRKALRNVIKHIIPIYFCK